MNDRKPKILTAKAVFGLLRIIMYNTKKGLEISEENEGKGRERKEDGWKEGEQTTSATSAAAKACVRV